MPTLVSEAPVRRQVVLPPLQQRPIPPILQEAPGSIRYLIFLGWVIGLLLAFAIPRAEPEISYDRIHNPERFWPESNQRYSVRVWRAVEEVY